MRNSISVKISGMEHTLFISDEAKFLKECLTGRIPAIALCGPDTGFMPFAAENTEAVLDDPDFQKLVVCRTLGIPMEICRTKRLIIREISEKDAAVVREIFKDGAETGFTDPFKGSLEETTLLLREYCRYYYDMHGYGYYLICLKETGEPAGIAGLKSGCELGYVIKKEYRRKGYMFEACSAILKKLSSDEDIRVCVDPSNPAGLCLAKKLGIKNISLSDTEDPHKVSD